MPISFASNDYEIIEWMFVKFDTEEFTNITQPDTL